ncbi:MAG: OmpH family outer membrane protein [Nitrospiria bacterium]
MKKVFIYSMMTVFLSFTGMASAESVKIGFVDAQHLLETSVLGKETQKKVEEYVKSRQKIVELEEKNLRELEEELRSQADLLTEEAKKVKQSEFQSKVLDFQKRARDLNQEVQNKKVSSLREFNGKMEVAIKVVAEKEDYLFVLDKNNEGGSVLYSKAALDITDKVLAQLDKDAGK